MAVIEGMLSNLLTLKGAIGVGGTCIFASRFILQWLISERRGESVIPFSFWILSIVGSAMLLTYAFLDHDPVVLLGQSTGIFVYTRNIVLLRRKHRQMSAGMIRGQKVGGEDE